MESSVFEYDPATSKGVLWLSKSPWAGKSWEIGLSVCANPLCGCANVEFDCVPVDSAPGGPDKILRFWLDVAERALFRGGSPIPSAESLDMGEAVAAELREPDWDTLSDYLLEAKDKLVEEADGTLLDADFPEEVMSGEGFMVGYAEIFPLASAFPFRIEKGSWLADDQYCVNPACRCRGVLLSFIRLRDEAATRGDIAGDEPAALYDYKSGKFETAYAPAGDQPALSELVHGLRRAYPELDLRVKKRHLQLKALYRRALDRVRHEESTDSDLEPSSSGASQRPARPVLPAKAGRNDPCRCGSGKKYKKCCGR